MIKNEKGEILKSACVIVENNQVLLVTGINGKIWSFPKGHLEKGETLEETAIREAKEETGYEVQIEKRLSDLTYTNKETGAPIRVAMFRAKPLRDIGNIEKETQRNWFLLKEAKEKLLYHKPSSFLLEIEE